MYIELLKIGLEEIRNWISRHQANREKGYAAIEAIEKAANETTVFLRTNTNLDPAPNRDLSTIWMDAASKVRDMDHVLYLRLIEKSKYWSDPASWSRAEIEKKNITLASLRETARRMLEERK